ncbi:VAN3-binding protein [Quillaja saponaria]|uniref:VAN3-binding protein n=1 Tax=Quillaja saponaria TaxID=32244 RepID=A0AAD7LXG6_QUISA|nr:VAN3-binding protein [Quillaja saponaria]
MASISLIKYLTVCSSHHLALAILLSTRIQFSCTSLQKLNFLDALLLTMSSIGAKCSSCQLENIDENGPANWLSMSCAPPDTPIESMEFLARSWSLSAKELSKALSNTHIACNNVEKPLSCSAGSEVNAAVSKISNDSLPAGDSSPISPRDSDEMKLYRSLLRGKTLGRWLKDQKEKKKQEIRIRNAQLHAAISVAGVAAAVAAIAASAASPEMPTARQKTPSKTSTAVASAASLVASHCIEIAEVMGADHNHILATVNSAINAKTNGDILTLTAGAATALRGAATLRARLQLGYRAATFIPVAGMCDEGQEPNILTTLDIVYRGGELLKRTRKGDLHWKHVSYNINSNWQVVAKLKSKHIAGKFTKKKKCVVSGVCCNIPAWPGRERGKGSEQRAYFGIRTTERTIEFECASHEEKQLWVEGIQHMLDCHAKGT